MSYKITQAYCWYDRGSMIVKMYFINNVPFTFDELPKSSFTDLDIIRLADQQKTFDPEDLFLSSFYLIDEEAHPLLFPMDLENPEDLPEDEYYQYGEEDLYS